MLGFKYETFWRLTCVTLGRQLVVLQEGHWGVFLGISSPGPFLPPFLLPAYKEVSSFPLPYTPVAKYMGQSEHELNPLEP